MSLRDLSGSELLNQAVEMAFKAAPTEHADAFLRLPQPLRNIYFISTFEFEYLNGGLSQFLTNGSGAFASETVTAFISVGALNTAETLAGVLDALHKAGIDPIALRYSRPPMKKFQLVRPSELYPAEFFEVVKPFHREINEADWDGDKLISYLEAQKALLP